jgi:hypothetical protein
MEGVQILGQQHIRTRGKLAEEYEKLNCVTCSVICRTESSTSTSNLLGKMVARRR